MSLCEVRLFVCDLHLLLVLFSKSLNRLLNYSCKFFSTLYRTVYRWILCPRPQVTFISFYRSSLSYFVKCHIYHAPNNRDGVNVKLTPSSRQRHGGAQRIRFFSALEHQLRFDYLIFDEFLSMRSSSSSSFCTSNLLQILFVVLRFSAVCSNYSFRSWQTHNMRFDFVSVLISRSPSNAFPFNVYVLNSVKLKCCYSRYIIRVREKEQMMWLLVAHSFYSLPFVPACVDNRITSNTDQRKNTMISPELYTFRKFLRWLFWTLSTPKIPLSITLSSVFN